MQILFRQTIDLLKIILILSLTGIWVAWCLLIDDLTAREVDVDFIIVLMCVMNTQSLPYQAWLLSNRFRSLSVKPKLPHALIMFPFYREILRQLTLLVFKMVIGQRY